MLYHPLNLQVLADVRFSSRCGRSCDLLLRVPKLREEGRVYHDVITSWTDNVELFSSPTAEHALLKEETQAETPC